MIVLAPGKLVLAGEYAVLEGRPCLVMAVDRRVVARRAEAPTELPREVTAALRVARDAGFVDRAPPMALDVSALYGDATRKLGLGSSAAACVAALGLAYAAAGRGLEAHRDELARVARRGHREAQGGGSGVDVLASAYGGVVSVGFPRGLDGDAEVARHPGFGAVPWAVLWSGEAARTSDMVARVHAWRARDEGGYRAVIDAVEAATRSLDGALRAGDARGATDAVRAHGEAMRALGEGAGAPVVTDAMARLAALAGPLGAAVKPSGAGGGDVVLAVGETRGALDEVVARAGALGFTPVRLAVCDEGVVSRGEG